MRIALLGDELEFPEVELALEEPNGLLAVGGDLSVDRLLLAYKSGIFPWYNDDEPILWWSPSPRSVLYPGSIHISRSTLKAIKRSAWTFKINHRFEQVMDQCGDRQEGSWINTDMQQAYQSLHLAGHAHSFEVWHNQDLIGGLYGVHIGGAFFGESMFHRVSNASKAAMLLLQTFALQNDIKIIDCQLQSDHLDSLGASIINRQKFCEQLATLCNKPKPAKLYNEVMSAERLLLIRNAAINNAE